MCSLGRHQEGEDIRPGRRRRLDRTATDAIAAAPAETIAQERAKMTKALRSDVGVDRPETRYAGDVDWANFEPVPPDQQDLPFRDDAGADLPYWSRMP